MIPGRFAFTVPYVSALSVSASIVGSGSGSVLVVGCGCGSDLRQLDPILNFPMLAIIFLAYYVLTSQGVYYD